MLDKELQEQIDKIYIEYINNLKPLIAFVEHNYNKFPKGVLKEFRDVFDHIARTYLEDVSEDFKAENIQKAFNHFDRLKLDIYKYLCDYNKKKINRWVDKHSKFDLTIIDNVRFWEEIEIKFDECEKTFFDGRDIEHSDISKACSLYEDYLKQCDEAFQYIRLKQGLINNAIHKQRRSYTGNIILGFILGIVGSLIASIIYSKIMPY